MTSTDLAARLGAGEGDELLADPSLRADPQLRGELLALDAFPAGCVAPALGHAVLCELDLLAIGAGSPGLQPHLAECAACAAEEADAKASLADLEAPSSTPKIGLRCVYCHDGLEVASAAYCASCLAIHHPECFSEHGTCAAPGCGELHWVRSSAPQPVALASPSRFRGLWQTAAALLVTALVSGGVYLEYLSGAREAEDKRIAQHDLQARKARRDAALAKKSLDEAERRVAILEVELLLLIEQQKYDEARTLIQSTTPLLGTSEADQAGLERLFKLLDLAETDATRYRKALEIIQARAVDRYPQAYDHLMGINPLSKAVYPDARAYLGWLEGERRLKGAKELLVSGQAAEAQALLEQAIESYRADLTGVSSETVATLQSATRSSAEIAAHWKAGLEAFRRAEAEISNDRLEQARFDLLLSIEHLPEGLSQVRDAQRYLDQLNALAKSKDERLLYQRRVDGFKLSVKRQDWRSAHDWANQLTLNHKVDPDWIMETVRVAEDTLKLFESGEKIVRDEQALGHLQVWARDVLNFLAAWLPPNDPKRVTCARYVQLLLRRGAPDAPDLIPSDRLDPAPGAPTPSAPTPGDTHDPQDEHRPDDEREGR
tara:strand:+ start:1961 stop:3772 length:1812 start_codon:yes stop_codon:yes gene_type:complete